MTGLDSLGTLPGILNYSEILKYSIELEIQESINSLFQISNPFEAQIKMPKNDTPESTITVSLCK